jgi:hypothetical protein
MLKQIVMLVFSYIFPFSVITTYHRRYNNPYLSITLMHLPNSIHIPCYDCVLIYTWFYNQWIKPMIHFGSTPQPIFKIKHHHKHTKFYKFLLLFMIYMVIQCGLVFAIHQNKLSISSLCITPTFILCNIFRQSSAISNHYPLYSIKTLPSTNDFSTNADKLSYLCAWNSIQHSSKVMMNFNPGGKAVCIDSGASSCISNDRNDFIHLEPSANTVLKGISSGLQIEGTGTLRWKITNDIGNEVTLYVHNSLYVPEAPMCLLSPQAVIQQTQKPSDGFQISADKGVFTFDSHQKTVYYNSSTNKNLYSSHLLTCKLHLYHPMYHPMLQLF